MKYFYKISVVIPVYNAEQYLDYCLRCLYSQTMNMKLYEIILINDGSKDKSGEICKTWESNYSNIHYIDKENEGVSVTRNLGIEKAKGKYILFLDPDDYLSKNALGTITTFFDKHYEEIDMVTYPIMLVYPNGRIKMHSRYKKDFANHNEIYDLNENYTSVQATINICIKNNKKYAFDTKQFYSEDEQFNTNVLMDKKKLGYVSDAYYYYRQHTNSVTAKKKAFDFENVYQFHNEFLIKYQNHPYIQSIIMNNMRWRIEEDCLYPDNLSIKEIDSYLESVTNRLKKIDFSLFKNYLKPSLMLELFALSNQMFSTRITEDGYYSIFNSNKLLLEKMISSNEINYLSLENNKLEVEGKIITGLYHDKKIELYAFLQKGNEIEKIKLDLNNELDYQKRVSKSYQLKMDIIGISKITFSLFADNKEVKLQTKNVEWCAKYKVFDHYQISVLNGIILKRKKFFSSFINKFRGCKSLNFLLVSTLSCFSREGRNVNLYFGEKNSELYELYLKDNHKKVFISKPNGIKYKKQILNCEKIITDKKIRLVLPFGTLRDYYVQAGKFKVVKK